MLCYRASQDHCRALTKTHPRLGQAEHLAALLLGCRAQEGRACGDLVAVEYPGCEEDQQGEREHAGPKANRTSTAHDTNASGRIDRSLVGGLDQAAERYGAQ